MTIVVDVADRPLEQVNKQLNKLINVLKTSDLKPDEAVDRELALFKVSAAADKRAQIIEIVDIFRAKIVDATHDELIIEATGTEDKIAAIQSMLKPYGIKEMSRTGKVALARGGHKTE
jgi:acetolactate synthase-1/3 small subunit